MSSQRNEPRRGFQVVVLARSMPDVERPSVPPPIAAVPAASTRAT